MSQVSYLADASPTAQPVDFSFPPGPHNEEEWRWLLFPYDTKPIALKLERWAVRFVRENVEKLQPAPEEQDHVGWEIYQRDLRKVQDDIQEGRYIALTRDWIELIESPAGWKEALYQCISYKDSNWTRAHVARLMRDPAKLEEIRTLWDEVNYPKKKLLTTPIPSAENQNGQSLPAGTSSSNGSLPKQESSPANLTECASGQ
jgi:hypothetical protein